MKDVAPATVGRDDDAATATTAIMWQQASATVTWYMSVEHRRRPAPRSRGRHSGQQTTHRATRRYIKRRTTNAPSIGDECRRQPTDDAVDVNCAAAAACLQRLRYSRPPTRSVSECLHSHLPQPRATAPYLTLNASSQHMNGSATSRLSCMTRSLVTRVSVTT